MRLNGFSDFRSDRHDVCWLAWDIPFYVGNEIQGALDHLSIGQAGRFIQWLDVGATFLSQVDNFRGDVMN
jgi:hypothetical protein